MNEISPEQLKQTVEAQHGRAAKFVQSVPIHETCLDRTKREGTVDIFNLADHPLAARVFAWSCEIPDSRCFFCHAGL